MSKIKNKTKKKKKKTLLLVHMLIIIMSIKTPTNQVVNLPIAIPPFKNDACVHHLSQGIVTKC